MVDAVELRQPRHFVHAQIFTWVIYLVALAQTSCTTAEDAEITTFRRIPAAESGVHFANLLQHEDSFNIYTYRNFYNGGGVAIGDVNGDTLPDLYFTANMGPNRLYKNLGEFRFEDITESAGVAGSRGWSTGVAMADINADGLLDIYVCNSGIVPGKERANELFINLGAGKFEERAEQYGLADQGLTTHAAFFDYDQDGDLDVYLLNNSFQAIGSFNLRKKLRGQRDSTGGDKLLQNMLVETGEFQFVDVSQAAGIYGSVIGFGLGVTVGDVNQDGWLDMYISNDFFERDYLYINQKDGTFSEELTQRTAAISAASMGADMADINNDGAPEIFVTDMLPYDERRLKLNTTFESWDVYQNKLDNDYFHQFTRNTLQLNKGDGYFAEVGRSLRVEASDWSWGALLVDLDTDGDRDLFVANGIFQDLTNQDYINFLASEHTIDLVTATGQVNFEMLVDFIPSEPIANQVFLNAGDSLAFAPAEANFGLADVGFSNGAAYGDLDLDGDLDLVVNNVNEKAWVYRNDEARDDEHQSLKVYLHGDKPNTLAYGAKIIGYSKGHVIMSEQLPTRGFQSSVEPVPFLGLGAIGMLDSLHIHWPLGKETRLYDVPAGTLFAKEEDATNYKYAPQVASKAIFREVVPAEVGISWSHRESAYSDFDHERLLYHMNSTLGPALALGDVDHNGLDDIYLGGAAGQVGELYLQMPGERFIKAEQAVLAKAGKFEDAAAEFFDADNDGDLDLLVASGSSEAIPSQLTLRDRLYLNDGRGNFAEASKRQWPTYNEITGSIAVGDFDNDGDQDVFLGSRSRPRLYGLQPKSNLLLNDKGTFVRLPAVGLDTLGMVGAAVAVYNPDGSDNLVVALEWGKLVEINIINNRIEIAHLTSDDAIGWWSALHATDIDHDGDLDYIVGNHGLNSRFRASTTEPISMLVGDFDRNGSAEQIISRYTEGESYPFVLRHDLVMQMPHLKKKYLKYDSYVLQKVENIFSSEELAQAVTLRATNLRSGVFVNLGNGAYKFQPFDYLAQLAPTYAIEQLFPDSAYYLLGGNLYAVKPEVGRYDASPGVVVSTSGQGKFHVAFAKTSGIDLRGEIRNIKRFKLGNQPAILVARNNDTPQLFVQQQAAQ